MAAGAGTYGIGCAIKQVTIRELDEDRFVARCVDTEGQYVDVATSVHPTGFRPQVGQIWFVDRDLGAWTFRALLDVSEAGPWPPPAPELPEAGPWTALTLLNGWSPSAGGDDPPPEARVTVDGIVELCGVITGGTVPAAGVELAVATLPGGLTVAYKGNGVLATEAGATTAAVRGTIRVDGTVGIIPWADYTPTWIDLSGLRARAQ